jgi:subtilisin family serine protease/subtilisin-like proprotein convertase family protein
MSSGEVTIGVQSKSIKRRSRSRRSAQRRTANALTRQFRFEPLEHRWMLAAGAPFTPPTNDPLFNEEWNLNNTGQVGGTPGADINVLPAWQQGYTGQGVTVGIVDSGVYYNHPDLSANYNAALSYNYFNNTSDAEPPLGPLLEPFAPGATAGEDSHGTEVAGIIAGNGANGAGTVGVAPNATIASERIITFDPTGNLVQGGYPQEYDALLTHNQQIGVYNNSWGYIPQQFASAPGEEEPGGDFSTASLTTQDGVSAMQQGDAGITPTGAKVEPGRGGLGNIYVFAAGNSNFTKEIAQAFGPQYSQYALGNSNDEEETASRFATVVAALGPAGQQAVYSDPGASILVSAPGGLDGAGAPDENGIPSSSVLAVPDSTAPSGLAYEATYDDDGTFGMNGTSAATPAVSGTVALMLQANPNLSWRDVQEILAESATKNDPTDPGWTGNGYGYTSDGAIVPVNSSGQYDGTTALPADVTVTPFHINNKYGFGEVNAAAAVNLAKTWTPLQPESNLSSGIVNVNQALPAGVAQGVSSSVTFTGGLHVEHVEVDLNITDPDAGNIQVTLTSPNGTTSVLQASRDFQANGVDYTFDGTLNAAGTAVTPNANYADWATSSVRDWGESSAGTWTVTVADMDSAETGATFDNFTLKLYGASDYAPVAPNLTASTQQNTPVSLNLLSDTYDTDGTFTIAPGSLTIVSQPANGSLSVNPQTGQVTYTPNYYFTGTDSFTYLVKDTNGVASRTATVTINTALVSQAPVAGNVTTSTTFGTPVSIDVLASDTDATGTLVPSTVAIVNPPNFGTATVNHTTGAILYTPGPNFTVGDSFTYTVSDSNGLKSNTGTVTINLAQPAPVANNVVQPAAPQNVTQQVNVLAGVTGSANPSSVTVMTQPQFGTTSVDPITGVISYTPEANFFGSDSFTFTVKNFQGAVSNIATVMLTVLAQGAPVALNHEFVLVPGAPVITGIRALDNPSGESTLTASLVSQASLGVVSLNPDGSFVYSQGPNFQGLDQFTYLVNNGTANSNVASIRLVSPNFHYVEKLYQNILNRTGSDSDILGWTAMLNAGVSRNQIALMFLNSPEYQSDLINSVYEKLLHRQADPGGLSFWIGEMQAGLPIETIMEAIAGTPEYAVLHGNTPQGIAVGLYQDLLGRTASPSDILFWGNQISAGTSAATVAADFLNSSEYQSDLVTGYYVSYLGHTPDLGGLRYWQSLLASGFPRTAIQAGILSSGEYFTG